MNAINGTGARIRTISVLLSSPLLLARLKLLG